MRRLGSALGAVVLATGLGLADSPEEVRPHVERPEDPPVRVRPADDPAARSAAMILGAGPYTSIQVNTDASGLNIVGDAANEPSIAVNPTNPFNIVIGWRQFDSIASNFRQAGWAVSTDRGETWDFPGVLTPGVFRSDPVLGFDPEGNVFYQSLTFGDSGLVLDVFSSDDDAATWGPPIPAFGGDKNWMTIDPTSGSGSGHIYEIWQRFGACCDTNTFSRSTDGGASFQPPRVPELLPTFGTMDVDANGTVFAVGIEGTQTQDFTQFVVSASSDAQDPLTLPTFTGSRVELGGSMAFQGAPNPAGLMGQANIAIDRGDGPFQDFIYVLSSVTPDDSGDPLDVHIIRSADGGGTWSEPVRVNDDPSITAWQWFGAHSVAPNGRVDAIWNDSRNSEQPNMNQLFYAYSYDAGATWTANIPVSPSFDSLLGFPAQNKLGDYYTVVSDETGADVAYAATFNGEQDVYYLRLFPDCNNNGVSDVDDIRRGTSLNCNGNPVPDECEPNLSCSAAGAVPSGANASGKPLLLDRKPDGSLSLTWGRSCGYGDNDYEVYAGELGDFRSHQPVVCTTQGLTSQILDVPDGDIYYLVVPRTGDREGSYGMDSAGVPRGASPAACLVQELGACLATADIRPPQP